MKRWGLVVLAVVAAMSAAAASSLSLSDPAFLGIQKVPTVTITSPAADPFTSTVASEAFTGTTTSAASVACTNSLGGTCTCTGAASWSCTVATVCSASAQTITVTATGSGGTATATRTVNGECFDLDMSTGSGVAVMPAALTINGVAVNPTLDYTAANAGALTWTATTGATLTKVEVGTDMTTGVAAPTTSTTDRAVTFGAADYYQAAASGTGDITTEDVAIIAVLRMPATSEAKAVVSKRVAGVGYSLETTATPTVKLVIHDGTHTATIATGTLVAGAWYVVDCEVDRSENSTNGSICHANGTAGSGVNPSTVTTLTTTNILTAGALSDGTNPSLATLAMFRVYASAAWFVGGATNLTQWATASTDLAAKYEGVYPSVARGAYTPTAMTRASTALVDIDRDGDGVIRLFTVGASWMRVARRQEATTTTRRNGYLAEPARTNLMLQSQDLATTWTLPTATDAVAVNTQVPPDGTTTGDDFDAGLDVVGVEHCVQQAPTLSAIKTNYSAFVKAGQISVVYLRDQTIANGVVWFNLTTCAACTTRADCPGAVGTRQAGITTARATNYGNGWCRVEGSLAGTAAAHTLNICGASADNVLTYTEGADATADWSAWQVDVLALFGSSVASQESPIPTTTATVTRSGDDLRYDATGNALFNSGSLIVGSLSHYSAFTSRHLAMIGNSAATINYVRIQHQATTSGDTEVKNATTASTASTVTFNTDDGIQHTTRATWDATALIEYGDGVAGNTVATPNIPVSIATIFPGSLRGGGGAQYAGMITRLRVLDKPVVGTVGVP